MTTLHHLALGTNDVKALASFYRDVLGLRELTRHAHADGGLRSIWLDLGGSVLMIEHTDAAPRHVNGIGAGPFLLAFRASREEQKRVAEKLASLGLAIEAHSEWTSYARDPDGNRIAFSAYPIAELPESTSLAKD